MQRSLLTTSISLMAAAVLLAGMGAHARGQFEDAPIRDAEHSFRQSVTSWKTLRDVNIVMQRRDYSCGAAALATVLTYYWGDETSESYLLRRLHRMLDPAETRDRIANGLTLTDLKNLAVRTGYNAVIGELSFEQLAESRVPLVVGIIVQRFPHFAVYRGTDWEYVYLADPSRGNVRTPVWEFKRQWQRNLVLVIEKPGERARESSPLSITVDERDRGSVTYEHIRRVPIKLPQPLPMPVRP